MANWARIASAAIATVLTAGSGAAAAELTVVATGGPLPGVMGTLGPMFERATGHKVKLVVKAGPAIVKDIKDGASIDLIVSGSETIDELAKDGLLAPGSAKIMQSRVGLGVREGAPKPDIGTAAALKSALLAAKTVAYSQGSSGQHFLTVIRKLDIAEALKPKTIVVTGQPVGNVVAKGDAEIGIQQVAELTPVAGVALVGPLPAELNKVIPYSVGIPIKAKEMEAAKALKDFISSEAAIAAYTKKNGMEVAH